MYIVCICSLIVKGAKYGLDAIAVWSVPASLAQISGIPTFSGQDFDMAFHFSNPRILFYQVFVSSPRSKLI